MALDLNRSVAGAVTHCVQPCSPTHHEGTMACVHTFGLLVVTRLDGCACRHGEHLHMATSKCHQSRTFLHLMSDCQGVRLSAPDVVPALEPLLKAVAWRGHPVRAETLTLEPARWPTLRAVGLDYLGDDWQRLPTSELWAAHMM